MSVYFILNLEIIYKGNCFLFSACFLNYNNKNYIIINHGKTNDYSEDINIFDFKGKKIKKIIHHYGEYFFFIDSYYDNKLNKNYIITGNKGYNTSYDYEENDIYIKYYDNDDEIHNSIIINDKEEIIKLIESSEDGYIRIWNFHSGELIKKIKANKMCYGIALWNNGYIFVWDVEIKQ